MDNETKPRRRQKTLAGLLIKPLLLMRMSFMLLLGGLRLAQDKPLAG